MSTYPMPETQANYRCWWKIVRTELQIERAKTDALEKRLGAMGKDLYIANARLEEIDNDQAKIERLARGNKALIKQVHGIEEDFFRVAGQIERIKAILREV